MLRTPQAASPLGLGAHDALCNICPACRQRAGVLPGMWVRFSSTQGSASLTVAHGAAKALLQSAGEWVAALSPAPPGSAGEAGSPMLVHGESSVTWTNVRNVLGQEADMLMDYGDHQVQLREAHACALLPLSPFAAIACAQLVVLSDTYCVV